MLRGTTPTLTFLVPYAAEEIQEAYITFAQRRGPVFEISGAGVEIEDQKLTAALTQEQTLRLAAGEECRIQLRLLLEGGQAVASRIIPVSVGDILKDGVI